MSESYWIGIGIFCLVCVADGFIKEWYKIRHGLLIGDVLPCGVMDGSESIGCCESDPSSARIENIIEGRYH